MNIIYTQKIFLAKTPKQLGLEEEKIKDFEERKRHVRCDHKRNILQKSETKIE